MLNSKQIEYELLKEGFVQTVNNARINGFANDSLNLLVYTKTGKDEATTVAKEPLIIHPKFENKRKQIDSISGVFPNWSKYTQFKYERFL